jgi:3-dehydroquinate synthetase
MQLKVTFSKTKTTLLHGEAIAAGMVLESFISLHKPNQSGRIFSNKIYY